MSNSMYTLASEVIAFSTTRKGGVSQGKYGEFNISEYCGDRPEHIAANRKALAAQLGIDEGCIVVPHQVHSTEVRQVDEDFSRLSADDRKNLLEGVDAVMTGQKGICIGVSTADCIPVLLYDGPHHAVAAIHAGWRGTVQRIVQKTVDAMHAAFHTDPKELKAVIGPGISLDNFEVGDEVYDEFAEAHFDMTAIADRRPSRGEQPMKWHIDLPLCNTLQLTAAGVGRKNIQQSGICTYAHPDEYFSARRLGTASGRIFTGILLKP